jgi:hypothetical protein
VEAALLLKAEIDQLPAEDDDDDDDDDGGGQLPADDGDGDDDDDGGGGDDGDGGGSGGSGGDGGDVPFGTPPELPPTPPRRSGLRKREGPGLGTAATYNPDAAAKHLLQRISNSDSTLKILKLKEAINTGNAGAADLVLDALMSNTTIEIIYFQANAAT